MKIKKNSRAVGKFFHKSPGIKCSHTKAKAISDITEECGDGKFYTMNYVNIESRVLNACKCYMHIIPIDTTIL